MQNFHGKNYSGEVGKNYGTRMLKRSANFWARGWKQFILSVDKRSAVFDERLKEFISRDLAQWNAWTMTGREGEGSGSNIPINVH